MMVAAFWRKTSSVISVVVVLSALLMMTGLAVRRAGITNSLQAGSNPVVQAVAAGPQARDFPTGFRWLNTSKPLSLRGLRGKIVLLDFWTYGCINCIHILPDLKKLETKYPNELVVIGVHSAKFEQESEAQNIRNAVLRLKITHPVVIDQNSAIWNNFGVNAWPSFVVIDAEGRVVGQAAGEGNYDVLDQTINKLVQQAGAKGKLNTTPLRNALEAARVPSTPLYFPAKVLADAATQRVYLADSGHNRIVITDFKGKVQAVAGSGREGYRNGSFATAQFRNPHGLALSSNGKVLYIADTDNHAIRSLNLQTRKVYTLAGTGKQASWGSRGGVGLQAGLSSPWDIERIGKTLYIAMAGPHQIWTLNLASNHVSVWAGSGREARYDGNGSTAALAQPSGLTTDGSQLFFADSESSSVRGVDLTSRIVSTVAGGGDDGSNLFEFGDVNASGLNARFQHPLDVEYRDGKLLVADTYNSKLKQIDLRNGNVETLIGGKDELNEPGGLSLSGNVLFIADTNHHVIKVYDFKTRQLSVLALSGVPKMP